jgi:hypothetical protein
MSKGVKEIMNPIIDRIKQGRHFNFHQVEIRKEVEDLIRACKDNGLEAEANIMETIKKN